MIRTRRRCAKGIRKRRDNGVQHARSHASSASPNVLIRSAVSHCIDAAPGSRRDDAAIALWTASWTSETKRAFSSSGLASVTASIAWSSKWPRRKSVIRSCVGESSTCSRPAYRLQQ